MIWDEFQQIAALKDGNSVFSSITKAVNESKHVQFILTGSGRYALTKTLQDSQSPFHQKATLFTLKRVQDETLLKYVQALWLECVASQRGLILALLSELSNNQKILLNDLAKFPTNQPYCKENLFRTRLTIASQKEALKKLQAREIIYEDTNGFMRVLDPAMRSCILALNS